MSDQTTRPTDLAEAIHAHQNAAQAEADEAQRPEREAIEAQLAADAKLYGTAGWDALSPYRRQRVSTWVAQQAQPTGGAA